MTHYDYSTGSRRYVPLAERTFKPNVQSGLIETRSETVPSVPLFLRFTELDFPRGTHYELWRGLRGYLVIAHFVPAIERRSALGLNWTFRRVHETPLKVRVDDES